MQRFSPDIPWVLVELGSGAAMVECEICQARQIVTNVTAVNGFAAAHRVHTAPEGSLRLGDAFAAVAKPVARAFGLAPNCTPCEARRRAMNALKF